MSEDSKKERKLKTAKLSSNVKVSEHDVSKDEIIEEYCERLAEVIPHLKELKKNELYRILMLVVAPPFLVGPKMPWQPKNRKEEAIVSHLMSLDDLKIALVEIISLEREAMYAEKSTEEKGPSDEQTGDRLGDNGTELQEG